MFDGAETKAGGKLHISDLVPMIFPKASKHQKKIIIKYVEAEIFAAKSLTVAATSKEYLSTYDMERLFECYDSRGINYVPLRYIRERLNLLQLPLNILVEVTILLMTSLYCNIYNLL